VPTYSLTAINVGSFALGETDKVLTLFSAERGLSKAVAKGARKPGAKIAGRADLLNVNQLLVATGRSLDIITQAESLETFANLRRDLNRLSYGFYYAELTTQFGQGLSDESDLYFEKLCDALREQAEGRVDGALLCLEFELLLLDLIGYRPELDFCVACRQALTEYNVSAFDHDAGGVTCEPCYDRQRIYPRVQEAAADDTFAMRPSQGRAHSTHITPLVWKRLILALSPTRKGSVETTATEANLRATQAGRRLIQSYIEERAGRKMKALELIELGDRHLGKPLE
jgi:DNA repair protein RecO (recombination protein O)